jgi:hypothetical protein
VRTKSFLAPAHTPRDAGEAWTVNNGGKRSGKSNGEIRLYFFYLSPPGVVPDQERSQWRQTEISSNPSSFHHRSSMG